MTRRGVALAGLLAMTLLVGACSGVPTSSAPEVVRTIGMAGASPTSSPQGPADDLNQVEIVKGFLAAMTTDPERHDAARAYLTADQAQKWNDSTITVVAADPQYRPDPATGSVVVTYAQTGAVSASGVYTPTLVNSGTADDSQVTFRVVQENGRFRIAGPVPSGLIITSADFASYLYRATPLYFPNPDGTRLVPDLRFSALTGQSLESFLLDQLIAGPRPELANVVSSNNFPDFTGQQRPSVTVGTPTIVQIPGAPALLPSSRVQLAAQLAATLQQPGYVSSIVLQDGPKTVDVPGISEPFDAGDFASLATVPVGGSSPSATFVRAGAVLDAGAKPISGPLGTEKYSLQSAAFDRSTGTTYVAGTTGTAGALRLLVGSTGALTDSGVPAGALTAPAWAPEPATEPEVWTASGTAVYRVFTTSGQPAVAVQLQTRTGPVTGNIVSIAFSPEGSRLAMVIRSGDTGPSQVWVASVFRSGMNVRLEQLEPITPVGIVMDDVGWKDGVTLQAVGSDATNAFAYLWSFDVDGSGLTSEKTPSLPGQPRAIATSPRSAQVWVTVGDGAASTVWFRNGGADWATPDGAASDIGTAPSFSVP